MYILYNERLEYTIYNNLYCTIISERNAERKRRKEGKRKEALARVKQREVVRTDGKKPCSFVDLK